MNKLYTIQLGVPICPECGGGMKFNQISQKYMCYHCGERFSVIGHGHTEREFICEREVRHDCKGNVRILG